MRGRQRHGFHGAHLHRSRQEEQAEPVRHSEVGPASSAWPEQPSLIYSAPLAHRVCFYMVSAVDKSPRVHISQCNSQPRKRQRLRRSRESGGGQRKASEQKHSRRAAAGRKTLIVAGVCARWAGTCVAVGWVWLREELAAQPRQRGQFIH